MWFRPLSVLLEVAFQTKFSMCLERNTVIGGGASRFSVDISVFDVLGRRIIQKMKNEKQKMMM